jgi:hypothetical protein
MTGRVHYAPWSPSTLNGALPSVGSRADVLPFVAYAKAAEVEASSGGVVTASSGAAEAGAGTAGAAGSPA